MCIKKALALLLCVVMLCGALIACQSRAKEFQDVIYVEKVEIVNEGLLESENFGKYVTLTLENGQVTYQIDYRVSPEDADNQEVEFLFEEADGIRMDKEGVFTFTKSGVFKVYVVATDGSNAEDTLMFVVKE